MKLLSLSLFAVGQLQLIDDNTVSSASAYWERNKARGGNFEFSRRRINNVRGLYNYADNESNNEKTIEQADKNSRMGISSEKVTEVKTNWFSPIVLMYQWYGKCHHIHVHGAHDRNPFQ